MKFENIGIDEEFWSDKTLEEFEKALKGKLRSDKIKTAYDLIPNKKVFKKKFEKDKDKEDK